jgi:hypothetical protein
MDARSNLENYVAFVKEQVVVQQKLANKYEDQPYRQGLHQRTEKRFRELVEFLERSKDAPDVPDNSNRSRSPKKRIQLTLEDITGLPDELLKELNITDVDRQELLIEHIIAQSGGILSLDKIMIELYKRTQEIHKRNTLTARLYRMANRGLIYNVPGKKGVYSTYEISEKDARRIFGANDPAEPELAMGPGVKVFQKQIPA